MSNSMESINFVHDVNILRKTTKSVYSNSADLKALNSELGAGPGNCRVQVLPVCWRHLIEFPRQRQRKGEHDLGDATDEEDECKITKVNLLQSMACTDQTNRPVAGRHYRGRSCICQISYFGSRARYFVVSELLPRRNLESCGGRD